MAKHKYIESPEKMYELFEKYKEITKSKPILQHDFLGGKELHEVRREKERPLTLVGFYNYCFENYSDIHHYFENTDKRYDEFRGICSRIKDFIRQDQIEGGMAGIYNPSITQRLNGLTEKTENTNKNIEVKLPDWMTTKDDKDKS